VADWGGGMSAGCNTGPIGVGNGWPVNAAALLTHTNQLPLKQL